MHIYCRCEQRQENPIETLLISAGKHRLNSGPAVISSSLKKNLVQATHVQMIFYGVLDETDLL